MYQSMGWGPVVGRSHSVCASQWNGVQEWEEHTKCVAVHEMGFIVERTC